MSTPDEQIKSIFLNAAEIAAESERSAYLDERCGDNVELRREIEDLLRHQKLIGTFLESSPVGAATIDQPFTEKPGTQIGPYKLLQQLGEGGMGVVYMAEQKEPVKRRVALKIIKPGMDTRQVIARFEAERQALAMMDHPNIAKVLDAGQTESGRPYFVMELVNGISITQYCDEQHLTPKERLELFVPICQAIQHAHQKGIIHRDLKPGNILVAEYDRRAVPKVIDFGVAKAMSQTLTEKTMFTQLGQIVGTLEYMSPEQAKRNQLDVDTRSDIYSLGVLLYELLTGETPFDRERLRSAAFDEMLRIIREEEPSKPSTKVSGSQSLPSIAANRRMEPARLGSTIRGELDWIVMKSLEKDRARRYETASKFAEDVQHYLNDEAVVACPPSAAYRFRKFARRNKRLLTAASVVALVMLLGTVISTAQAIRATKAEQAAGAERAKAEQERENARRQEKQAKQNLQLAEEHLQLATAERERAEGNLDLALAALDAVYLDAIGKAKLLGEPVSKPDEAAPTLDGPAFAFQSRPQLTDLERELLKRGVDFYEQFAKQNPAATRALVHTARAHYRVGVLQTALGDTHSAEAAYRAAIERFKQLTRDQPENAQFHERLAESHAGLSIVVTPWSRAANAIKSAIDCYSVAIKLDPKNAHLFYHRSQLHRRLSQDDQSLADIEQALRLEPDNPHFHAGCAYAYLPRTDRGTSDLLKAQHHFERAVQLSPQSPHFVNALGHFLYWHRRDLRGAYERFTTAIELDPNFANPLLHRAHVYLLLGQPEKARDDVAKSARISGQDSWALVFRARIRRELHDYDEALADLAEAQKLDPHNYEIRYERGNVYTDRGQYNLAVSQFSEIVEMRPRESFAYKHRARPRFALGKFEDALQDLSKALELRPKDITALIWISPSLVARCRDEPFREGLLKLADSAVEKNPAARGGRLRLYLELGLWDKARADFEERTTSDAPNHYDFYQYALLCLAQNDLAKYRELCARMAQQYGQTDDAATGNFVAWTCALHPDAVDGFEPAINLARVAVAKDAENAQFQGTLGAILYRAGQDEEARKQLSALAKQLEEPDKKAHSSPAYLWYFLAMSHKSADQDKEAREYLARANAWTEEVLADQASPPPWNRRETLKLLRKEAEALIKGT